MKKSQLRKIIKEEISKALKEESDEGERYTDEYKIRIKNIHSGMPEFEGSWDDAREWVWDWFQNNADAQGTVHDYWIESIEPDEL